MCLKYCGSQSLRLTDDPYAKCEYFDGAYVIRYKALAEAKAKTQEMPHLQQQMIGKSLSANSFNLIESDGTYGGGNTDQARSTTAGMKAAGLKLSSTDAKRGFTEYLAYIVLVRNNDKYILDEVLDVLQKTGISSHKTTYYDKIAPDAIPITSLTSYDDYDEYIHNMSCKVYYNVYNYDTGKYTKINAEATVKSEKAYDDLYWKDGLNLFQKPVNLLVNQKLQ